MIVMICDYKDGYDGGDHQKDEDKHRDNLSPHETSVIVKPTVVVVAVLSNQQCNQINASF